jgi:hypothetical protein
MNRQRTTVYTRPADLHTLRDLAAACGLVQTRGIGVGEMGSISKLLDTLAAGYTADPGRVIAFITRVKVNQERTNGKATTAAQHADVSAARRPGTV